MSQFTGAAFTARVESGAVVIEDLNKGRSVTNDAAAVISTLVRRGYDLALPVIYRDTAGEWDGLRVRDGRFSGFYPLGGAQSYAEARTALKAREGDDESAEAAKRALEAVRKARTDPFIAALNLDTWEEVTLPRETLTCQG